MGQIVNESGNSNFDSLRNIVIESDTTDEQKDEIKDKVEDSISGKSLRDLLIEILTEIKTLRAEMDNRDMDYNRKYEDLMNMLPSFMRSSSNTYNYTTE